MPIPQVFRDQERAAHAYEAVAGIKGPELQRNYQIAVNELTSTILRGGLCAALAAVERRNDESSKRLLRHLATARVKPLAGVTGDDLSKHVRQLRTDEYILVTREVLKVASWLKRAAQASFRESVRA